jgi:hypothetical protein
LLHFNTELLSGTKPNPKAVLTSIRLIGYCPWLNNDLPPTNDLLQVPNVASTFGILRENIKTFRYQSYAISFSIQNIAIFSQHSQFADEFISLIVFSDFDENGLIWWLGTDEGRRSLWRNPASSYQQIVELKL